MMLRIRKGRLCRLLSIFSVVGNLGRLVSSLRQRQSDEAL